MIILLVTNPVLAKTRGVNELFSITNTTFLFLFHGVRTSILGFASSSCWLMG